MPMFDHTDAINEVSVSSEIKSDIIGFSYLNSQQGPAKQLRAKALCRFGSDIHVNGKRQWEFWRFTGC